MTDLFTILGSAGAFFVAVWIWRMAAIGIWLKAFAIVVAGAIALGMVGAVEITVHPGAALDALRAILDMVRYLIEGPIDVLLASFERSLQGIEVIP